MKEDQIVNPWEVKKSQTDSEKESIDYTKIINQFGCQKISEEIIEKLKTVTKIPVHHLIRRNIVFAHRDFDKLLDKLHKGNEKMYLYTGRGPSSQSMHIGHAIPFLFCKYLQDAFDAPLVIQITDDEKFLWKDLSYEDAKKFAKQNIKDIVAFGFDPKKTFIFTNTEQSHRFVETSLKIGKSISFKEASKVFGFDQNYSISQVEFPAKEIAPCFAKSFQFLKIIHPDSHCLVPAGIDQDPFFRLARDKAHVINAKKPSTLYGTFLPDLNGLDAKMSASDQNTCIYLTDSRNIVKKKINKHAFSGGRDTLEEHKRLGGRLDVDVAYHYLRYFLDDDDKLNKIAEEYSSGRMSSGEIKKICIDVVSNFLEDYQEKAKNITDDDVEEFMRIK